MNDIFEYVTAPDSTTFASRNDPNDIRLGEIIPGNRYEESEIVILGCPQDEGVRRNLGREGAALAPEAIRREFYKFTPFGIKSKIFDLGNTRIAGTLEDVHERHKTVVKRLLEDGKKVIILGGGNDVAYPDGRAMSDVFGARNWIGVNIDAHFDVRADQPRNSGTPYRQLLDEKLILPEYFFEIAYQTQLASPTYFRYLEDLGVHLMSLEQIRSREEPDLELREMIRHNFVRHSASLNSFFGFDLGAVRMADAPGVSAPSPVGLRAGEFITLVKFAAGLMNTKLIEFTEVNPIFDIDNRTAKLVAVAMHRFCAGLNKG